MMKVRKTNKKLSTGAINKASNPIGRKYSAKEAEDRLLNPSGKIIPGAKRDRGLTVVLDPDIVKKIALKKRFLKEEIFTKEYTNYPECLSSKKPFSLIKAYAMNCYQGIIRDYNEDKIVGIMNVPKPPDLKIALWPKVSYFGIFDGHGGETCSTFLQKNLLNYIITNKNFPMNPKDAIKGGFERADFEWRKQVIDTSSGEFKVTDDSGTCAVIALIVENLCFIANIGDSRAIMSYEGGKKSKQITIDHKPNDPNEKKRIIKSGGTVYLDENTEKEPQLKFTDDEEENKKEGELNKSGSDSSDDVEEQIYRVLPGKLAVSRSIGDICCKCKESMGNPAVVISEPDIFQVDLNVAADFIMLGCDGIFDVLSTEDVVEAAWYSENLVKNTGDNLHLKCVNMTNYIMKAAMELKSEDNLSVIVIALNNFEKIIKTKLVKEKVHNSMKSAEVKK
ncbi:MAG: protein phosphatase 2C domain-containing protein [archaeon]|nr:protein phosphatase 2C domain-containing protein [archaeon]